MSRAWRVIRWVLIVIAGMLLLAQLVRPAKTNPATDPSQAVEARVNVPPQVAAILNRSCADCHSNKTVWPWYTNVAPVSWFVINHVNEGRRHLNFSEWGKYTGRRSDKVMAEICDQVKMGEMPLSSYTPLHPDSSLSDEDKRILCDWANSAKTAAPLPTPTPSTH